MAVYLITYDLNKPHQDYVDLINAIESLGDTCHIMKSVWLVDTHLTLNEITDQLILHIDKNDYLLIDRTTNAINGFVDQEHTKWLSTKRLNP